ncbi:glycerol-3-phosphate 1-O-acyltransferase PlsY [Zeimonas arvi]|uniref:Glycerol-3-phosphate acyltransferase n=1 Tax=Zeimonas arvi TaxID=2498847 RepID=A0A5C8P548_9BURK|nr:glycerol-3-phosphate 1-O-acyltransferase PlsY [Zeimonas arvi]TXL68640.1 glycerol-3-phosphate 1-O-acyltransferase PlsY [Zeimonas arvi]
MEALYSVLAVVAAYLIGSVSFAVVVSKAMGLADPRSYGSKNPGATNVLRTGNRKAALFTLLGDALKGVAAVLIAKALADRLGFGDGTIALVALAAFVGHLFPVFHGFKGGKGVATAAGVLIALHPLLGLGTLLTWILIAWFFRYSSLAALVSAVFAPLWYMFLFRPDPIAAAVVLMSLLLVWRHSANIQNLLAGKESRIGEKKGQAGTQGREKREEKARGKGAGRRG